MESKKKVVFTGGGSGGHSVVAMTLIEYFRSQGQTDISYIGSQTGIERELCKKHDIPYYPITTGKLRRYLSFENVLDFFKVGWGVLQSFFLLITYLRKTNIVFSTGGFVSVPAAIAGKVLGKKIYLHEQTTRVGLANKIVAKLADKVFLSFESSKEFFPEKKSLIVGYPLRKQFHKKELEHLNFQWIDLENPGKPILFITGGGNGALKLNQLVDKYREALTEKYIVIHQTGKLFLDDYINHKNESYLPIDFIGDEFPDLLKAASVVVCRAGAGTVSELIALKKNVIFIPLKIAQRNEQFHNAEEALKVLKGTIVEEDNLENFDLVSEIDKLSVPSTESPVLSLDSERLIFVSVFS